MSHSYLNLVFYIYLKLYFAFVVDKMETFEVLGTRVHELNVSVHLPHDHKNEEINCHFHLHHYDYTS